MVEIISAIIGAITTCVITIYGINLQFEKQKREQEVAYRNDLVSMLDILVFQVAKIRNNQLTFDMSNLNRQTTNEILSEVVDDYNAYDMHLQNLVLMMSHHIDESNKDIQEIMTINQDLVEKYRKFDKSVKIYKNQYSQPGCDKNIVVRSKINLDITVGKLIDDITKFGLERYSHKLYRPALIEVLNKNDGDKYKKYNAKKYGEE
ncbi:hypothetical protein [Staphylococcus simulans]|nr:hypothetical protein [Staphylococcus simulans]PTJ10642.1 hypothetical protein BU044_04600 [Staphylococcus simulans]PTJ40299.1 hypothetical protein BU021_06925 [Staphylococcus simulans]PTJ96237.1 hypothetical protein BU013_08075 [Staphylococcus simulans]